MKARVDHALESHFRALARNLNLSITQFHSEFAIWNKSRKCAISRSYDNHRLGYARTIHSVRRTTFIGCLSDFFIRPNLSVGVLESNKPAWKHPFPVIRKNNDGSAETLLVRFLTLRVLNSGKAVAENCLPFAQLLDRLEFVGADYPYPLRWGHQFTISELGLEEELLPRLLSCFADKDMRITQRTSQPLNILFTVENAQTHLFSGYLVTDDLIQLDPIFDVAFMVASTTPHASKLGMRFRIFLKSADDFEVTKVTRRMRLQDVYLRFRWFNRFTAH